MRKVRKARKVRKGRKDRKAERILSFLSFLSFLPFRPFRPFPYTRPIGIRPVIDRIMRPRPPLPMPFIIFCICRKFLSSLLISATCVPDPDAIMLGFYAEYDDLLGLV